MGVLYCAVVWATSKEVIRSSSRCYPFKALLLSHWRNPCAVDSSEYSVWRCWIWLRNHLLGLDTPVKTRKFIGLFSNS